jgi:hypothetical protein
MAFAVPVARAESVKRVSLLPLMTVAITLAPAADLLIASAMPATVLFVESMTTSKI